MYIYKHIFSLAGLAGGWTENTVNNPKEPHKKINIGGPTYAVHNNLPLGYMWTIQPPPPSAHLKPPGRRKGGSDSDSKYVLPVTLFSA